MRKAIDCCTECGYYLTEAHTPSGDLVGWACTKCDTFFTVCEYQWWESKPRMTTEEMNEHLLAACILEKWMPLANTVGSAPLPMVTGGETCVLCQVYHPMFNGKQGKKDKSCRGCPVYEHTGEEGCLGTPFDGVHGLLTRSPEWKLAVQSELDFLISLLPAHNPLRKVDELNSMVPVSVISEVLDAYHERLGDVENTLNRTPGMKSLQKDLCGQEFMLTWAIRLLQEALQERVLVNIPKEK